MRRVRDCPKAPPPPQITTPMVALAFSVLNCPASAAESARVLAQLVLEAADA